jgi:hypothetical protein
MAAAGYSLWLYLIADLAERGSFTVRELLTANVDSTFVSPLVAFG